MLAQAEIEAVECLAPAAEFRDDDTGQHTRGSAVTPALLAVAWAIDDGQVELIRRAAPLHDVGKIGIPDQILLKPGRLTTEEFAAHAAPHDRSARASSARHHTPLDAGGGDGSP